MRFCLFMMLVGVALRRSPANYSCHLQNHAAKATAHGRERELRRLQCRDARGPAGGRQSLSGTRTQESLKKPGRKNARLKPSAAYEFTAFRPKSDTRQILARAANDRGSAALEHYA